MTPAVPTVTARSVLATTRALNLLLGALLVPLLAQHLFGSRGDASVYAGFMLTAGVSGAILSRRTVRDSATLKGTLAVGLLAGLLSGVAVALAWVTAYRSYAPDAYTVGPFFGALYGSVTGLGMGAVFALWMARARAALAKPSAVGAQRLTTEAGLALVLAGALGTALYHIDALRVLSLAAGFLGTITILVATVRLMKLNKLFARMGAANGGYQLVPRAPGTQAPAFAWVPPLDHVVVHATAADAVAPGPFRADNPAAEVVVVPKDLSLVHRALGRAVAFGLASLGFSMLLYTGVALFSCAGACCGSAPCGGCAH